MAQSYIVFDFGANEDSAQQARNHLDTWRQTFHLSKKLEYKFERKPAEKKDEGDRIRVFVRLDFSDHEKLSHQRWIERIPMEPPFKGLPAKITRSGDAGFAETEKLFEELK
ncbi:MAG TPA: hypothetical protein VLV89_03875 [Candidatus Acidoferrum sp.]|nr:hypothetical protein [Candidatus Acidoferrum sp.]